MLNELKSLTRDEIYGGIALAALFIVLEALKVVIG
jgi:hypothetical protein